MPLSALLSGAWHPHTRVDCTSGAQHGRATWGLNGGGGGVVQMAARHISFQGLKPQQTEHATSAGPPVPRKELDQGPGGHQHVKHWAPPVVSLSPGQRRPQ